MRVDPTNKAENEMFDSHMHKSIHLAAFYWFSIMLSYHFTFCKVDSKEGVALYAQCDVLRRLGIQVKLNTICVAPRMTDIPSNCL